MLTAGALPLAAIGTAAKIVSIASGFLAAGANGMRYGWESSEFHTALGKAMVNTVFTGIGAIKINKRSLPEGWSAIPQTLLERHYQKIGSWTWDKFDDTFGWLHRLFNP
ncbi:hypothetical protein ACFORH_14290 [Amycolatopsis roodepoortensis]|uniref:Uncharacterized protein n=1 Tax=Amycolatopsis roodepoortensis TaxID=700274 RepID=A0ABR9KYS2_9PSEU|nr:hypothetical protein [Amycolatopsis roodepoortensis]MBE1573516.1 hypothetical protein [Amycolatopsis roodepoortensis]